MGCCVSTPAIFELAERGDAKLLLTEIKEWKSNGNSINGCDVNGLTALMTAVYHGHTECAQILLDNGASVDYKTEGGPSTDAVTALFFAATYARVDCLKVLLENSADLKIEGPQGMTALEAAAGGPDEDTSEEATTKFISTQAVAYRNSPNVNDRSQRIVHIAGTVVNATRVNEDWIKDSANGLYLPIAINSEVLMQQVMLPPGNPTDRVACLELLLEKGADVQRTMENGKSALFFAAEGNAECVEFLLEKGVDVNHKDEHGSTALNFAVAGGHTECLKILLEKHAVFDHEQAGGYTALLQAADGGHAQCLKILMEKGADFNHVAENGYNALILAAGGSQECLQMMLEKGGDIKYKSHDGHCAAALAIFGGQVECLRTVLDAGIDVNDADNDGVTLLMQAAYNDQLEAVKLLVEKGADVGRRSNDKFTAVMYGCCSAKALEHHIRCTECTEFLANEAGGKYEAFPVDVKDVMKKAGKKFAKKVANGLIQAFVPVPDIF